MQKKKTLNNMDQLKGSYNNQLLHGMCTCKGNLNCEELQARTEVFLRGHLDEAKSVLDIFDQNMSDAEARTEVFLRKIIPR